MEYPGSGWTFPADGKPSIAYDGSFTGYWMRKSGELRAGEESRRTEKRASVFYMKKWRTDGEAQEAGDWQGENREAGSFSGGIVIGMRPEESPRGQDVFDSGLDKNDERE